MIFLSACLEASKICSLLRVSLKTRVGGIRTKPVPVLWTQVIFRSDRVLHRVLPCHAERFMLTVWIDSPDVNAPEESTLRITRSQLDDWCVSYACMC